MNMPGRHALARAARCPLLTYLARVLAHTGGVFPLPMKGSPMSKLTIITDRALELAEQAGAGLRSAGRQAGSGLRHAGHGAEQWIKAGAALGAARASTRAAATVVRRNPVAVAAAAAVVGAGVLAYVMYRKRRQQQANAPIEGEARQVRDNGNTRARASRRRSHNITSAE